jgi:OHCU decarboxylase
LTEENPPHAGADDESLRRLNSLAGDEARAALLACCGSEAWARLVSERRPFADERELFAAADRAWWGLGREDWLEAFRSHPRIGERKAERETGASAHGWAEDEQSATRTAARETLDELGELNRAYEERFGHIYIVCATGKSSAEMLELLRRRLANQSETELCVAAEEQRRITRLRLKKLLAQLGPAQQSS